MTTDTRTITVKALCDMAALGYEPFMETLAKQLSSGAQIGEPTAGSWKGLEAAMWRLKRSPPNSKMKKAKTEILARFHEFFQKGWAAQATPDVHFYEQLIAIGDPKSIKACLASGVRMFATGMGWRHSLIGQAIYAGKGELALAIARLMNPEDMRWALGASNSLSFDLLEGPSQGAKAAKVCQQNFRELLETWMAKGMPLDRLEYGSAGATLLSKACSGGYLQACVDLLAAGADPLAVDKDGRSALHAACDGWNDQEALPICQALLAAGADPLAADRNGDLAMDLARRGDLEQCAKLLAPFSSAKELSDDDASREEMLAWIADEIFRKGLSVQAPDGSKLGKDEFLSLMGKPQTSDAKPKKSKSI